MADPLSDILKLADAQPVLSGGFTAGGSWGIRFPEPDKIKFFALVNGYCWLRIDEQEEPVRVEEGDVILLSAQRSFTLSGGLDVSPLDANDIFSGDRSKFAKIGEGEDCVQIGGHVRLDPVSGWRLAEALPRLIHIQAERPQASVLQWLLHQLVSEQSSQLPGTGLASSQLTQLMFIQILRVYLEIAGSSAKGLLRTVRDQRIAPALRLMHSDPGHPWHLEDLAKATAMSRTTFAMYFKKVAGVGPLTYLTEWRMRLAEHALREDKISVSELAQSLGYTSESAFSHAFKRMTGMAPKHYRISVEGQFQTHN
ncbi:MAG TPA: AraC family transcriptional regulator [Acidobacteriaceae bacterium]